MQLSEDILHFVWRHGLFDSDNLATTNNEPLSIVQKGFHNLHSGPDFMESKVKIGDTLWAGQVEIHVHSSDWYLHQHETDPSYENVILHVVYFDDKEILIKGKKLPTLVLNGRIPPIFFSKYKELLKKKEEIACARNLPEISSMHRISQIERSVVQRLIRKSEAILHLLKANQNDWEETSYQILGINLIGKLNEQPAEWLLNQVKLKHLRSSGSNGLQKEAILLGVAGLLNDSSDEYATKLSKEYDHQQKKYLYTALESHLWRFGRIRPAQFPTLRLAQLAAIVNKSDSIFEKLLQSDLNFILHDFLDVHPDSYWETHHQIGKSIVKRSVAIGQMQKELILINVVAPLLFAFGQFYGEDKYKEKCAELLMNIKPEKNHILKKWSAKGWKAENAFDSQGLIELYNNSCIPKKCLTCNIGTSLLKK